MSSINYTINAHLLPASHMSSTVVFEDWPMAVTLVLMARDGSEPWWCVDVVVTGAAKHCEYGADVGCTAIGDLIWEDAGVVDVRLKRNFAPANWPGVFMLWASDKFEAWQEFEGWELSFWLSGRSCSFNEPVCTRQEESVCGSLPWELNEKSLRTDAFPGAEVTERAERLEAWILTEARLLKEVTISVSDCDCFCTGFVSKFLRWNVALAQSVNIRPLIVQFATGCWIFGRRLLLHKEFAASVVDASQSFELSSRTLTDVGDPSGTESARRKRRTRLFGVIFK